MSGLLSLLDDVASIAKIAAASVDDVFGQAAKAGSKAAGALIDDAAVTPKYLQGFDSSRELPMVWKIAKGSIRNKLLILLPVAVLLATFAAWAINPLLMLGGAYLCFEGAEKIVHSLQSSQEHHTEHSATTSNSTQLEEARVAGAIKTDFILSAEIMTIALASITVGSVWFQAAVLTIVAIAVTVAVYGSVALIVKADDLGLRMVRTGSLSGTRALGRAIVAAMPHVLLALSIVGTAAMLWVGGSIVVHGLHGMHIELPDQLVSSWSAAAAQMTPALPAITRWIAEATLYGVFGLILGLALLPLVTHMIAPAWRAVSSARR